MLKAAALSVSAAWWGVAFGAWRRFSERRALLVITRAPMIGCSDNCYRRLMNSRRYELRALHGELGYRRIMRYAVLLSTNSMHMDDNISYIQ